MKTYYNFQKDYIIFDEKLINIKNKYEIPNRL